MKTHVKLLAAALFVCVIAFNAVSQIWVWPDGDVLFRTWHQPHVGTTHHYGDLVVRDNSAAIGRGMIYSERAYTGAYLNVGTHLHVGTHAWIRQDAFVHQGLYVLGNKYFVHPHPTDDTKFIKYIAAESGEPLTIVRGTAKTVNGEVVIKLPEHFSMVTSATEPVTVILTPVGAPALLYTRQASRDEIVVAVGNDFREVEFAYQVTGVRDGFENQRIIVTEDELRSPDSIPDSEKNDVQRRIDAYRERAWAKQDLEHEERMAGAMMNFGENFEAMNVPAAEEIVTIQTPTLNHAVRNSANEEETAVAHAPAAAETLKGVFAAGPNPADRRAGAVMNFFYQGEPVKNGQLRIYNAAGSVVNKIRINDRVPGGQPNNWVALWDLTDKRGRLVSEGTYLVRGTLVTQDGKRERVMITVGVR